MSKRTRVLVAGLGDTGVLCAGALARRRDLEVVGVSPTTGLVSGQELGLRLADPGAWSRDYRIGYRSFRRLDRVEVVHGRLAAADLDARTVQVEGADGSRSTLAWDALVVATGVANGFWRSATVPRRSGRRTTSPCGGRTSRSRCGSPASARCRSTTAAPGDGYAAGWRPPGSRCTRATVRSGLEVFDRSGRAFRIPRAVVDRALQPLVVKRGIYGGVRRAR